MLYEVITPIAAVVGGFSKPMLEEERKELLAVVKEAKDFCVFSLNFAKENVFPKYLDVIKTVGVYPSGYLGTVRPSDGALEFYDGEFRMMDMHGNYEQFKYEDYQDYIAEHVEPWTYLKFPYRITSYNVCYTKLLRCTGTSGRSRAPRARRCSPGIPRT